MISLGWPSPNWRLCGWLKNRHQPDRLGGHSHQKSTDIIQTVPSPGTQPRTVRDLERAWVGRDWVTGIEFYANPIPKLHKCKDFPLKAELEGIGLSCKGETRLADCAVI